MFFEKAKYLLPVFIACVLAFSGLQAMAAENARPAATAGKNVKTGYFEITIPKGWVMPRQTRSTKRGAEAIFSNNKAMTAVQLSVLDSTKTAKEMAEVTAKDMRSQKLSVSDPVEAANGFYTMEVDGGPMPYRCWIGANGKTAGLTMVLGKDVAVANEILKAVKTTQKGIFPASVR